MRGRDIKRNGYEWAELYLLNVHNGIKEKGSKTTYKIPPVDINNFPSVKNYLDKFKDEISARQDQGITIYNLRDCAYMEDFNKPKIVYSEIVQSPQFYLDTKGFFPEATTFILNGNNLEYLIKVFNSKIVANIFKNFYSGGKLNENGYRYKKAFFETLPIPLCSKENLPKILNSSDDNTIELIIRNLFHLSNDEYIFISKN